MNVAHKSRPNTHTGYKTGDGFISACASALVLAAALYAPVLCWLFSRGLPINNTLVALVDAGVILSAGALVLAIRPGSAGLAILALLLNAAVLALISQAFDVKSLRDGLAIVVFLSLGIAAGNTSNARRSFFIVGGLALAFGAFELLAPSLYAQSFHVLQFYIMRGLVDPNISTWFDGSLFVSSIRGGARNLLPMLGPHRVSSIFMEPVSMGNFGAIAVAWALSLDRRAWRTALTAGIVGIAAIVMADARFAAIACVLFAVARFIPTVWSRYVLAPAPFLAVALLFWANANLSHVGDDLPSRLANSGATVEALSVSQLFALAPGGPATVDSGYAYLLTGFGLPFALLMWCAFVWLPTPNAPATRFKLLIGLYICALLCVSGSSMFALKTGALLWFLLGAAIADAPARVFVRATPQPTQVGSRFGARLA